MNKQKIILIQIIIFLILIGFGYYLINDLKAFTGITLIAMAVVFINNIEKKRQYEEYVSKQQVLQYNIMKNMLDNFIEKNK